MSFHPLEAVTGAIVIPLLVFSIPIHFGALLVVLGVMTFMGVANHLGWEIFPAWLVEGRAGRWLITASHHHRHHQQYGCNYGLYFRIWDRLCGTDKGLGAFDGGGRGDIAALGGFRGAAARDAAGAAQSERAGPRLPHPQP